MATKKELEDKIKVLKEEIRTLRVDVKETEVEMEGLDSVANGIVVDNKSGHFNLVTIKYNVESNKAAIESVKDIGKNLAMASSKIKKAVIDTLVSENKGRK